MKRKILTLLSVILCVVMMGALSSCIFFEDCTHEGFLSDPVIENEKEAVGVEPGSYDKVIYCEKCKAEVYRTTVTVVNTLLSSDILMVDGTTVSGSVPSAYEVADFTKIISVSSKYSWRVTSDEAGEQELDSSNVALETGDNTVYVRLVDTDGALTVFTVNIYRKRAFTVTFQQNGGLTPDGHVVPNQTVDEGELVIEPEIVYPGYVLRGWFVPTYGGNYELYDFSQPVHDDIALVPLWKEDTNIKWTVEYYFQKLASSEYELDESKTYVGAGSKNAFVKADTPDYEGFTLKTGLYSGNIKVDGSLLIKVYYDRNKYKVTSLASDYEHISSSGGYVSAGGTYQYGASVTLEAYTNSGYTFLGWYVNGEKVGDTARITFTVTGDVSYRAKWMAQDNIKYTVYYRLQDLEGDGYTILDSETFVGYGTVNTQAYAEIKEFEGFVRNTKKGQTSCAILGDGTGSINVFYDRITYEIKATPNYSGRGSVSGTGTARYGATVALVANPKDGYRLEGWYKDGELVSDESSISFVASENVSLEARFVARDDVKYKVNYYYQYLKDEGSYAYPNHKLLYGVLPDKTEEFTGTTGKTVKYGTSDGDILVEVPKGYYFDTNNSTRSGTIKGDGSLVLNLYFALSKNYKVDIQSENTAAGTVTTYAGRFPYGIHLPVEAKANDGYDFVGWYDADGNLLSSDAIYSFQVFENVSISARWQGKETTYTVFYYKATPTSGGTYVSEAKLNGIVGETVTAPHLDSMLSQGYVIRPGSEDTLTGTVLPNGNLILRIYYVDLDVGYCEKINGIEYLFFGQYPQTLKAEDVTITDETDSRGYFKGSDGFWYAKVVAETYKETTSYKFSNGEYITSGTEYYFKVELIRWREINWSPNYGTTYICDSIIANGAWGEKSSNMSGWVDSSLRAWLNDTFYNTAFNDIQKKFFYKENTVLNSVLQMDPYYAQYLPEDARYSATTKDLVYLASYQDMVNKNYGFSSDKTAYDEARIRAGSDYAKANGLQVNEYGNGWWWMRSRGYVGNSYAVQDVQVSKPDGSCNSTGNVDWDHFGIVPLITLNN